MTKLERYFKKYRKNIVGLNKSYESPYGKKRMLYADWTASGRLYKPIEQSIIDNFGPFLANPHTDTNVTGTTITEAYQLAQQIIKDHVHADHQKDIVITDGAGMTGVVNKLQRLLGLRLAEKYKNRFYVAERYRPVIFVTHMEHHSNHTSWLETIGDVVVVPPNSVNDFCLVQFKKTLEKYKHRKRKIAAITACSNVTGIETPYHEIARIIHSYNGLCFVDFACSAPYVNITMRPKNPLEKLDAIYFSPHKFLGGPGTSGVLIFDKDLYRNNVPDHPGGGTVKWTDPWGGREYLDHIETKEDGGTPDFLQVIKTAMCIRLKEQMGVNQIRKREEEQLKLFFSEVDNANGISILKGDTKDRLGVISFYSDHIHYNLFTKLLCDRYGIQARGGCSCAGTYGHFLLGIDKKTSNKLKKNIQAGCNRSKPGWVRISFHPTMTNREVQYITSAMKEICENYAKWSKDYEYVEGKNTYIHKQKIEDISVDPWFEIR